MANYSKYTLATQSETTVNAYLMASFAKDDFIVPFKGNFGFRVVYYRDRSTGYQFSPEFSQDQIDQIANSPALKTVKTPYPMVAGGRAQTDILPSFNIQFNVTDELKARLAFSQSVSRPSFDQMNPTGYVSGTNSVNYMAYFSGSWGNPQLKPMKAEMVDASLEYYFQSGGSVHLSAFWKSIHNFISTTQVSENRTFTATWDQTSSKPGLSSVNPTGCTPITGAATASWNCTVPVSVTQYFNEKSAARIDGFEVGVTKYASFLPDPFNGFGMDVNFTYIDSGQPGAMAYDMQPANPNTSTWTFGRSISNLPVTGLSKNTVNVSLMFDKAPFSMRVAYNWRSSYLASTAAWQTSGTYSYNNLIQYNGNTPGVITTFALPVYAYPVGQLDANMTIDLTDDIAWTMEASNLTHSVTRLYMMEGNYADGSPRLYNRSWYMADTRYTTQLRWKF